VFNFLLALTLFVLKVAEAAIVSILTSALGMKAAAAAKPSEMPKGTPRWQISKTFSGHQCCIWKDVDW